MLLELVLVAAVLGLVGIAVYQSNHRANSTASLTTQPAAANSTVGLANSAATISQDSSSSDAALSASAETSADQVSEPDVDVSNLGGSTSANSY